MELNGSYTGNMDNRKIAEKFIRRKDLLSLILFLGQEDQAAVFLSDLGNCDRRCYYLQKLFVIFCMLL